MGDVEVSETDTDNFTRISPAARIKELVEIDKDLTKILRSAGEAFRSLKPGDLERQAEQGSKKTLDQAKDDFALHANDFFTTVQSVAARMRRQAYALDEANIIPKEPPQIGADDEDDKFKDQQSRQAGVRSMTRPVTAEPPMPIVNGGLGNLDVGWLNSRRDEVGMQKEAELWSAAREMVERILEERKDKDESQAGNHKEEQDDIEMGSP